jgi:hypothetical protein
MLLSVLKEGGAKRDEMTTVGNANACLACLNLVALGWICAYCCAPRPQLGVVQIGESAAENEDLDGVSSHTLPLLAVAPQKAMERDGR